MYQKVVLLDLQHQHQAEEPGWRAAAARWRAVPEEDPVWIMHDPPLGSCLDHAWNKETCLV